MSRIYVCLLLVLFACTLTGCLDQPHPKKASHKPGKEAEVDIEEIEEGTGPVPKDGQTCVIHYTGKLRSGKVFDSSYDRGKPFEFVLGKNDVIKGWEDAVSVMHVGGKYKVTVPAELGYGAKGQGDSIPGNAVLIFEMELLKVKDTEGSDKKPDDSDRHQRHGSGMGGGRGGGM